MNLSWRDAIATVLVAAAGALGYARLKGFDWPLLASWRTASLALLVVGLGTCIVVGSGVEPAKNAWTTTATAIGIVAVIAAFLGLILDSKYAFLALLTTIVALWLVTTLHHLVGSAN